MARTNMMATRIKPDDAELLVLRVLRSERISPNFARVTLGGDDIERFTSLGFDQWFRLFIPVSSVNSGEELSRLPKKLSTVAYARYLMISKSSRPVLRSYSVRAYRDSGPAGPELDVDFVLHGTEADGTAGPAATWARACQPGDTVAIMDEGVGFNPPNETSHVVLVADETGLAAAASILESLPRDAAGRALLEVPSDGDKQSTDAPSGVEVTWVVRAGVPGRAVLAEAVALDVPAEPFYGWVVGEQNLPTSLRRHWVSAGVPKEHIMFCGYWKSR